MCSGNAMFTAAIEVASLAKTYGRGDGAAQRRGILGGAGHGDQGPGQDLEFVGPAADRLQAMPRLR